jgi:hypothetical protein
MVAMAHIYWNDVVIAVRDSRDIEFRNDFSLLNLANAPKVA